MSPEMIAKIEALEARVVALEEIVGAMSTPAEPPPVAPNLGGGGGPIEPG